MEILYARSPHAPKRGRRQRNPRFYAGPDETAARVIIDGDYPQIAQDYAALGIPVEQLGAPPPKKAATTPRPALAEKIADAFPEKGGRKR
jgi:hypothetical protein